jgi:hypothetical protein
LIEYLKLLCHPACRRLFAISEILKSLLSHGGKLEKLIGASRRFSEARRGKHLLPYVGNRIRQLREPGGQRSSICNVPLGVCG